MLAVLAHGGQQAAHEDRQNAAVGIHVPSAATPDGIWPRLSPTPLRSRGVFQCCVARDCGVSGKIQTKLSPRLPYCTFSMLESLCKKFRGVE